MDIKNLDTRQKVIIAVIVLAVILLFWLLFGGSSSKTAPVQMAKSNATFENGATKMQPAGMPGNNVANMPNPPHMMAAAAEQTPSLPPPQLLAPEQAEYLRLVDQYQLAQVRRLLAEQNAAIAQADASTAKSKNEASKYVVDQPNAPRLPGISISANETTSIQQMQQNPLSMYQVAYIGNSSNGSWKATLVTSTGYINVRPGTTLTDGSKVAEISADSVTITQGDKKFVLPFVNNPMEGN